MVGAGLSECRSRSANRQVNPCFQVGLEEAGSTKKKPRARSLSYPRLRVLTTLLQGSLVSQRSRYPNTEGV